MAAFYTDDWLELLEAQQVADDEEAALEGVPEGLEERASASARLEWKLPTEVAPPVPPEVGKPRKSAREALRRGPARPCSWIEKSRKGLGLRA